MYERCTPSLAKINFCVGVIEWSLYAGLVLIVGRSRIC